MLPASRQLSICCVCKIIPPHLPAAARAAVFFGPVSERTICYANLVS